MTWTQGWLPKQPTFELNLPTAFGFGLTKAVGFFIVYNDEFVRAAPDVRAANFYYIIPSAILSIDRMHKD